MDGTYVVLLLVHLVRNGIFGGGETRGGVRVGVAFGDLWGVVLAVSRQRERRRGYLPSLPRLEVPDIAPWTDSEAWLTVFLEAQLVSNSV